MKRLVRDSWLDPAGVSNSYLELLEDDSMLV